MPYSLEALKASIKIKIFIILLFLFNLITLIFPTSLVYADYLYGLNFDGSNDYVDVGSIPSIGNGSVTVEAWVKPVSFGNWNYIFSYGQTGDNALIAMVINSSGNLVAYIEADGTNQITSLSDGAALTLNQWNHVAIVLDRTNNTITRYLNGQQLGTASSTSILGSATISSQGSAYIAGANNKITGEHFDGILDELRIWTTARTQSQIQSNMYNEIVSETDLIARWGFSEGSGTSTIDSAGSSITGTISGALWVTGYSFSQQSAISVSTNEVTQLKNTTVTLNGNLTSLGQESSVDTYFKYGLDSQNLNNTTTPSSMLITGSFSANITNLLPGTTYYYQAFATAGGVVQGGTVMSFGVNALDFNTSDNVKVGDVSAIESSQYLTVEAYARGYDFTNAIVVAKHSSLTNGSFYLAYIDSNTIRFTVITNTGRYNYDVTQALDNNWHHIAGVYDGVAQTVKIYYDGVQIGATGTYSGTIKANTLQLIIGNYNANDWAWVGQIDEVRVWNVARTAEEINTYKDSEIDSAEGLVARWGLNEGAGTVVFDSTGNGNDGTISGATWTTGKSFNMSPTYSLSSYPTNSSTATSLAPQFVVQPTDPENQNLTVKLYGRVKQASESNFTLVVLPDTQYYSASYPNIFNSQTTWITNNVSTLNIKMVLHEGDVVDTGSNSTQWTNAVNALSILSQNNIPTIVSIGNHDYNTISSRLTTNFNNNINYTNWYSSKNWFNGGSFEPNKSENVYTKMTIGSKNYLFMTLEFGPRDETLSWARNIIESNPDHLVIIVTHNYMYSDDTRVGDGDSWNPHSYISSNVNDGDEVWDNLVSLYPNVLMVLSGHILNDGLGRLTSTCVEGNSVYQMLANYQMNSSGGGGYLRYLTFKPSEDLIEVYTYSPYLNQYNTSNDNQFTYNYDFYSADNYNLIDTETNIPSGNNTILSWSGLESNQEYEWYLNISDGQNSVNTSVSSFTTNNRPSVVISDPSSSWENNDVTVSFTLSDPDTNTLNLTQSNESGIEYSTDGSTWNDATGSITGVNGLTGLSKNILYNFVWDTSTDIPNIEDETVYIRIRPNDGELSSSTWTISNAFKIDNLKPSGVGQVTFSNIETNSVTINKPSTVTENASGVNQWRVTNNLGYQTDFVSTATESITINSLLENTEYTYSAIFKDTNGNISDSGQTNSFYTKLSAPSNISSSSVTQTQITVNVDDFQNDSLLSSGYYFERAGSNSGWVQTSSWTDTGLTCGTTYTYYVKYRNANSTETAYTSLSVSTLACSVSVRDNTSASSTASTPSSTSETGLSSTTSTLTTTTPLIKKEKNTFYVIPDDIVSTKLENDVPFFEPIETGIALKLSDSSNILSLFNGQELKVLLKPKKPAKSIVVEMYLQTITKSKNKNILFSIVNSVHAEDLSVNKYELYDENSDGIFEGNLKISGIPGEYVVKTTINYKDGTNKEVVSKAAVQSTGYIYQNISGKQLRIPNAVVKLLKFDENSNNYEIWNSDQYHQKNPIITNQSGEYIFFVPDGKYQIEVDVDEYMRYKSDEIIVEGNNYINRQIEVFALTNKYRYLYALSIPIVFLIPYYLFKKKQNKPFHKIKIR